MIYNLFQMKFMNKWILYLSLKTEKIKYKKFNKIKKK